MRTFIVIFSLFLAGCSAGWHISRARLKDPSLFVTKIDTVRDTIFVEVARIDTLFKVKTDTIEFWKDSVYVKYFYERQDSTVYIEIDCPDSEIITNTITEVETIIIKPTFWEQFKYALFAIGGIVVIFGAFKLFK